MSDYGFSDYTCGTTGLPCCTCSLFCEHRKEKKMERKRLTAKERILIWNKSPGHCAYCGCEIKLEEMQADHVVPLYRGGKDEIENLLPACRSCNHYKSTLTVEEFREQISKWHERLMRDDVTYKNAVRFGQVIPKPHRPVFYFEKH